MKAKTPRLWSREPAPIGTVRIHRSGKSRIRVVKVTHLGPQQNRWRPVALDWWLKNKGPVPEGLRVVHLNGDTLDDRPENYGLLDAAGVGISQIVGVGGRDLSADIGGIMFRQAMHMLAADDETETLLLVSKPPAPEVVASLADDGPDDKRVGAAFVGWDGGQGPFEIHGTLDAAARAAAGTEPEDLGELEAAVDAARERSAGRRLLGLFSGGSLAHEAVTLLEPALGPLEGNVGHGPDERNGGHAVLDLGEEEYTQGRPHPMVDLDVRLGFLREAAEDDAIGCVLLDVVLGHGGHADPASGLSDAIAAAAKHAVVLARVCGTVGDPQDATRQTQILRDAGAIVAPSNAAAARLALRAIADGASA
ncbi:MAG: hypothetical protein KY463_12770 [Actinobacteria bacterium]|nr:hypothetical protein [Actinomycetota bacterium]